MPKRASAPRPLDVGRPPLIWIAYQFLDDAAEDDSAGPGGMRQQAFDSDDVPF